MKFTKLLAIMLCMAMFACVLVSCNTTPEETDPIGGIELKTMKVSFKVKDLKGKILFEETDYDVSYIDGHEPTILSVIEDYVVIDCEKPFESKGNNFKTIGDVSESSSTYWVYHEGTAPSDEYKYVAPGTVYVTDGFSFTVLLVQSGK